MNIVIIGTGSIGKRHIKNILTFQPDAKFTFVRQNRRKDTLSEELNATVISDLENPQDYDFIVIANPSAHHMRFIELAIMHNRPFFVEKPVVSTLEDCQKIISLLDEYHYTNTSMVGCNLRYLPSLSVLKNHLNNKIGKIVRASFEAGKYLPDWRPESDYTKSYSALKELGGGVILDLIHEIDIARWLLGDFDTVKALYGKFSDLEIETEDTAAIIMSQQNNLIATLTLDYVNRESTRLYKIVGTKGTLEWDLIAKKMTLNTHHKEIITDSPQDFDVNETYLTAMDEFMTALKTNSKTSSDITDGLKTTELALYIKELN